jgi:hypothetical protein
MINFPFPCTFTFLQVSLVLVLVEVFQDVWPTLALSLLAAERAQPFVALLVPHFDQLGHRLQLAFAHVVHGLLDGGLQPSGVGN